MYTERMYYARAEQGFAEVAVINPAHARALNGPGPVDRARPGSKHHLITEAHGIRWRCR